MLVPVCLWLLLQLSACGKDEAAALAAAKARIEKKQDAAAEIDLKNLLQRFPRSGEARFLLGRQLHQRGEATAALIEFERALALKYPDSIVTPEIASVLMAQGKTRQVVDEFAGTVLSDPNATAQLQALVAQAMAAEGDMDNASALIDKAALSAPTSEPVLLAQARLETQAGKPDRALAVLDRLILAKPASHLAWTMKGSVLGLLPGQIDVAMDAFRKAVLIRPDDIAAHTGLLALAIEKGDIKLARSELDTLQKLAPRQINTQYHEANLAYASGQYVEAQSLYQSILKALPLNPQLLINAAETELKLNATAQAETLAAKALTQAPDSVRARTVLAQVYMHTGQPAKVLNTLAGLIDSPGVPPQLLALAAQAQLMNGKPTEAQQLYDRLARLNPTDPWLRTLIASSRFGKVSDETVFNELRQIAKDEADSSADRAIITAHLDRQQTDAALQALTALDRKRPADPALAHLRGQILAKKSDRAGARKSFDDALKIDSAYYPSVAALAALDLLDNRADAAEQRLKDLLKAQPKDARAMLAIAELMARQQRPQADVLRQLEAAVKAAPGDAAVHEAMVSHLLDSGQLAAALTAAQAATGILPDNPTLLALQARCFMRLQRSQQALSSYSKIITLYPKSPRGHLGMAEVHLQNNDLALAQRSNDRALELVPDQPEAMAQAMAQAIQVATRRQQFNHAITLAKRLQTDRPQDATGLLLEAEVETHRSHWAAASSALRKALDLPEPGAAAIQLHAVLLKDGRAKQALAFSSEWRNAHPRDVAFMLAVADVAMANGDSSTAEQGYRQLLEVQPDHAPALNNLAMLHLQLNKAGALALAERAAALAPTRADMLDTLAQALARDQQLTRAVQVQQRAVALAPDLADLRLTLAGLLVQAGDKPLARAELERLSTLGPRFAKQDEVTRLKRSLLPVLPGR